jgi:beta-lactamase regulating signal transducer with metallopeptidase domain
MLLLSVPFYDFPSSPILIIGAIGIVVALAVFFLAYQKYFNSPLNRELQLKKKALLNEKIELNKKLEKIEQDLKNL